MIASGVILPVVVAFVTAWWWPTISPDTTEGKIVAVVVIGLIGGAAAPLLRIAIKPVLLRSAAPRDLWSADQLQIAGLRSGLSDAMNSRPDAQLKFDMRSSRDSYFGKTQYFLRVTNVGAGAEFHADLTISGMSTPISGFPTPASWDRSPERTVRISAHESKQVLIADCESSSDGQPGFVRWYVYEHGKGSGVLVECGDVPKELRPKFKITVQVFASPDLIGRSVASIKVDGDEPTFEGAPYLG